jgi:spermidine/putrescine transport system permease protein
MKRILAVYASAAYLFLYLPLAILGVFSFNGSKIAAWRGFTLDWYRGVFHNPALFEGTMNSLIIALAATAVSTVIGTLAG